MQVQQRALHDAVTFAKSATGKGRHLPIMRCVKIEDGGQALTVSATNGDLSITCNAEGDGSLNSPAIVPADLLASYLGTVKGEGTIESKGGELVLEFSGARLKLRSLPEEDWPQVPHADGESTTLPMDVRQRLERIVYAASKDYARPILTGVSFADGWAAATDSYRLAAVEAGVFGKCVVPARALNLVFGHAAGNIGVVLDERRMSITTHRGTISTRLIEGQFPNWRGLVPAEAPVNLTVNREELIAALGRVDILAGDGRPVRLTAQPLLDAVELSVQSMDIGTATEVISADAAFEGTIGLSPAFLSELAKAATGETLSLSIASTNKPVLVGSLESGGVHLLMPIRIA